MKNVPQSATKLDISKLDPLIDKLDTVGLTFKQRQFIFHYNGNAISAAEAAGYGGTPKYASKKKAALAKVVYRLMQNEKIQRNIYLIQKQLEAFGVLTVAEAKDIVSDIARTSGNERNRLEAAKLALQWEGALIDPIKRHELDIKMQQHNITEYRFAGPMSNFLKNRQVEAQETIDIIPEPNSADPEIDLDDIM